MSKKILVQCPTRSRPEQFQKTIQGYIDKSINKDDIYYHIRLDSDDPRLEANMPVIESLNSKNTTFTIGKSGGKIYAINDFESNIDWEILVLYSDDMICKEDGWDIIISSHYEEFPDKDVMWYDDGFNTNINCMCILSRKYYEKFGYIYNPSYYSLWCDNEFTDVSIKLNKCQKFEDVCLFYHEHYSRSPKYKHKNDQLMKKNESFYFKDKEVYDFRKSINFELPQ